MKEKLAELAHEQWSGWMKHLFSKMEIKLDGTASIPAWAVTRWQRQMNTEYKNLSEEEKNSDREEAERVIKLIERQKWENAEPRTEW